MTDPITKDAPPPGEPVRESSPVGGIGVQALRRHALAFGFGIVSFGILALLIAIYLQLGTRSYGQ